MSRAETYLVVLDVDHPDDSVHDAIDLMTEVLLELRSRTAYQDILGTRQRALLTDAYNALLLCDDLAGEAPD